MNIELSAREVFEILNVRPNEKFEITNYNGNPHKIIYRNDFFELVDCNGNNVDMVYLKNIILHPYLIKKINQEIKIELLCQEDIDKIADEVVKVIKNRLKNIALF